jgi:3-oxoacyl-[acyl-carrier protein] reductase
MKDQVALVTGGSRGIGKAISENLAKRGVNIIVAAVNYERVKDTAREIEKLGVKTLPLRMDVSNAEDVNAGFNKIKETFGRLDVLVNNAGITRDGFSMRMSEEDWETVLNINLKGAFLCSKKAVKLMIKNKYGRIINISSIAANGNPGQMNYSASKAGLVGLTKTMAKEYAPWGITSNAVAPGFIDTEMTHALPDEMKEQILKTIPLKHFGSVSDVANAVSFLASPDAEYVTGNVIHVNGGMYM